MRYKCNESYFNEINTEEKAYWLGFIWCDGYVYKNKSDSSKEYVLRLVQSPRDIAHLEKLNEALSSNYPIPTYSSESSFGEEGYSRLSISSRGLGEKLYRDFGMIPHRKSIEKLIAAIPEKLERHFVRGVFDAEGSATNYFLLNGKNKGQLKSAVGFTTYYELTEWIQDYFIRNNIKDRKVKPYKRHAERDGACVDIKFSGVQQSLKILTHLYEDSNIYLERKYNKLLELEMLVNNREKMKNV